jgi:D-alanyl-D-alanine endopeptidase (penicillin-binding protein 7)
LIYIDLYLFWGILLPVGLCGEYKMKKILLICVLAGGAMVAQAGENGEKPVVKHHVRHHAGHPVKHHVNRVSVRFDGHAVHHQPHRVAVRHVKSKIEPEAGLIAAKYDTELASFQPASSPKLMSSIALIYDEQTQHPLYTKNPDAITPIASITKLMTAMVVLDSDPDMYEEISVAEADQDSLKGTHSRLGVGTTFVRSEMLKLALMSSENRAASALARNYPGGTVAAVAAMNAKARQLGMLHTTFRDPTGLNSENVSTARDLVKMVAAAHNYKLIHQFTTTATHSVEGQRGRELIFNNTNPLVKSGAWEIGLSKTGFINEAGRCLVMQAQIRQRQVIIVLLDSVGKSTRIGDANRVKKWIESTNMYGRIARRS